MSCIIKDWSGGQGIFERCIHQGLLYHSICSFFCCFFFPVTFYWFHFPHFLLGSRECIHSYGTCRASLGTELGTWEQTLLQTAFLISKLPVSSKRQYHHHSFTQNGCSFVFFPFLLSTKDAESSECASSPAASTASSYGLPLPLPPNVSASATSATRFRSCLHISGFNFLIFLQTFLQTATFLKQRFSSFSNSPQTPFLQNPDHPQTFIFLKFMICKEDAQIN